MVCLKFKLPFNVTKLNCQNLNSPPFCATCPFGDDDRQPLKPSLIVRLPNANRLFFGLKTITISRKIFYILLLKFPWTCAYHCLTYSQSFSNFYGIKKMIQMIKCNKVVSSILFCKTIKSPSKRLDAWILFSKYLHLLKYNTSLC